MRNLSMKLATKVYIVLAEVCGARDVFETVEKGPYKGVTYNSQRDSFVHEFTQEDHTKEWRFSGKLGFGGKFWHNNDKFYVSCYSEDETLETLEMIKEANKQLTELYKEYVNETCASCIWYSSAKNCKTCFGFINHEQEKSI